MNLLASAMSYENKITIIILCVAVAFFIAISLVLLFSLHRNNKKLAQKRRKLPEPVQTDTDTKQD